MTCFGLSTEERESWDWRPGAPPCLGPGQGLLRHCPPALSQGRLPPSPDREPDSSQGAWELVQLGVSDRMKKPGEHSSRAEDKRSRDQLWSRVWCLWSERPRGGFRSQAPLLPGGRDVAKSASFCLHCEGKGGGEEDWDSHKHSSVPQSQAMES